VYTIRTATIVPEGSARIQRATFDTTHDAYKAFLKSCSVNWASDGWPEYNHLARMKLRLMLFLGFVLVKNRMELSAISYMYVPEADWHSANDREWHGDGPLNTPIWQ
jgi:hypothetical protein